MTYNNENIFARIIKGEADCVKILENDYILSFMDVMPQTPGHTLVIPKYGTENIFDLPEEYFIHLMDAKQKIAKAIKKASETTFAISEGSLITHECFTIGRVIPKISVS